MKSTHLNNAYLAPVLEVEDYIISDGFQNAMDSLSFDDPDKAENDPFSDAN